MQDSGGCACALGVFVVAFWLGLLAGIHFGDNAGREAIKKEAVESGHAEYVIIDPTTGKAEFRWRDK